MSPPGAPPLVVKLGGSTMRTAPPLLLLQRFAACPGVVLVPGGGRFADAVRDAQPQWGLGDRACHQMAILAMEQMAHAIRDLVPGLAPCRVAADFAPAPVAARLWFPAAMAAEAADIPASWDVSSDSLALWLARRIGARALLLVKAPGLRPAPATTEQAARLGAWADAGLVDAAFQGMARGFEGDILLCAADDDAGLTQVLRRHAAAPGPHAC